MADHRDDFIIAIRYALLKKGAKQKFSLFFLILLSISIITLDKFSLPLMSSVRSVLNDFVYHVSVVSSQPSKLRKHIVQKTKTHYDVIGKNKFLIEEIEFLKKQKFNNAYLALENEILKEALDLSKQNDFEQNFSISAKVMLDQESPFLKSLLINKGTNNNIIKGMTVFSKDYLMGTIIETNYLTSRVLLLTDLNSKLPIIVEGTNTNAILEGTGKKRNLRLSYLPENYEIEPNKIIFTSGKDGFLSPGIPVALTYLGKKDKVLIKLLADPDQALVVNVTNGQINQ
jgi:rod shape-determining protein MreC